jgi:hypothetical protein
MGAALIRGVMQMWNGDVAGGLNLIWETFKAFNPITIISGILDTLYDYIKSKGIEFYNAGANIVKSIADGILSSAKAPIDAISGVVSSMRDYLPFSPAKVGPFKDLHKLQISQTIAESINPAPLMQAMGDMTGAAMQFAPTSPQAPMIDTPMPSMGGGGGMVLNFSPQITINGLGGSSEGGIEQQVMSALRAVVPELSQLLENYNARVARKRF